MASDFANSTHGSISSEAHLSCVAPSGSPPFAAAARLACRRSRQAPNRRQRSRLAAVAAAAARLARHRSHRAPYRRSRLRLADAIAAAARLACIRSSRAPNRRPRIAARRRHRRCRTPRVPSQQPSAQQAPQACGSPPPPTLLHASRAIAAAGSSSPPITQPRAPQRHAADCSVTPEAGRSPRAALTA